MLAVRFSPLAPNDLVSLVEERLRAEGMIVLSKTLTTTAGNSATDATKASSGNDGDSNEEKKELKSSKEGKSEGGGSDSSRRSSVVMILAATEQAIEQEAEEIRLVKRAKLGGANSNATMERFKVLKRSSFLPSSSAATTLGDIPPPPGKVNSTQLFTSSELALLVERIFRQIPVLGVGDESATSELLQIFQRYNSGSGEEYENEDKEGKKPSSKQEEDRIKDLPLSHLLILNGMIDLISPIHQPQQREDVLRSTWWPLHQMQPDPDPIQQYYGWEVAFYFAFLGFLSKWLVFPAAIGLIFFAFRHYRGDTLDDDEYTPFFGILTFFWAVVFVRFWEREEARLSYKWGTFTLSGYERMKFFAMRPSFTGTIRVSPVTGLPELYYSPIKRRIKYVVSLAVTVAMLAVAFVVMIVSLNLQGYIRPRNNPLRWNDRDKPHPFHYGQFSILAEDGRIFDASSWRALLPVVIHCACIFSMNSLYRQVAVILTDWENHENQLSHNNSLVLKRFLFEAFDCYIALFYLAFYERDCDRLNAELVAIFQVDSIRRVMLESVLPMILNRLFDRGRVDNEKKHEIKKGTKRKEKGVVPSTDEILKELETLDLYEDFDDFMEIIIQIGYVTLFASAYPLASVVAIVANWIEIRNDIMKLSRVCQRPTIRRAADLGMWKTLMKCIVWMSALTNCLIAGFTSDQLVQYMPRFYVQARHDFTSLEHDKGWLVVFVIFGLEHVLIVFGFLITALIPDLPADVSEDIEKQHFEQQSQRRIQRRGSSAVQSKLEKKIQ